MGAGRSIVAGSLRTVGTVVVFVASLAGGVLAHLDAAATRRTTAAHVNAALANVFVGTIAIESIGRLSLTGVDDVRVSIDDASGNHVIVADGVHARIDMRTLVRSLFASSGPLVIDLSNVSVRDADVDIDDDASGALRLATVFARRSVAAPSPPSTPGRGVTFSIGNIGVTHARVHGQPAGAPPVDACIDSIAASLAVAAGAMKLEIGGAEVTTRAMPHGADAKGALHATLAIPAPNGSGVSVEASWKGAVGAVAETVTITYDEARVDAVVDVPTVTSVALRTLWPDSPIEAPGSVHAEAHGALSAMDVKAHVSAADGSVDLSGTVDAGDEKSAQFHVDARAIDLAPLLEGAPASDLGLAGEVTASLHPDGSFAGEARIEIARGTLAGAAVPETTILATVARDETHGLMADATVTPHEPGATALAEVHVRPKGASLEASFDVTASAPQVGAIARVGAATRGRATAKAHGIFDVSTRRIDAELEVRGGGIARGSAHLGGVSITARATGPIASPLVVADLRASDLAVGTTKVESIHATASGTPPNIHATAAVRAKSIPTVDARADLDLRSVTTIRNLDAVLTRNGERAHASAAALRVGGGGFDAENVLVEGVGAPARVTVRTSPHAVTLRAFSAGINIGRLARLLGAHETIDGDTAAFDIDATLTDGGADGHVGATVSRCTIRGVGDVSAKIDATLHARHAVGKIHVALGDIASVDASFKHLELGPGGSAIAAFRAAWGSIDFSGRGDLAKLRALFPAATSSLGEVSGEVVFEGHAIRDSSTDDTPEVRLSGYTSHLALAARAVGDADPAWQVAGTDVGMSVRIDGTSGDAELSLRAQDSKGVLVSIDAKASDIPYTKLLATPDRAMVLLEAAPVVARIDVPRRSVTDFPEDLPVGDARGDLTAVFVVGGTFGRPSLDGSITMDHARSKFAPLEMPLDLVAAVHYDAMHALVRLGADVRERHVLDGEVDVDAAFTDLIDTERRDPMPWMATAKAHIDRFPLKTIASLDDRDVRGEMTGDIEMDGIHEDGKAMASFDIGGLTVAAVSYPKASFRLDVDGSRFAASARVEQADGFVEVRANAGTHWGRALVPRIDGRRKIEGSLEAKSFHASALLPFVSGVLTELDGRIDGKASASFDPVARKATSNGLLTFSDGQLEVAAFGGELRDVGATLAWTPDGLVQIPKLTAQMSSGEVDASGSLRFEGLSLASANFVVTVPKKKRIPLTLEGVQLATVDGRLVLEAASSGADHGVRATVDVPTLHADLPATGSRNVQALGAMSNVTVHVQSHDGKAIRIPAAGVALAKPAPTGAPPISVTIKLGKDVEIRRGTDLRVSLEGDPAVSITDATRMSGQIRIPRGSLNVDGKPFRIESGTVTFVGDDPTNPQVVLTASWPAPDGATTVYADFVGPLKTGRVSLRSDPPHTKDEILALILYGTADGQSTTASDAPPGTTAAAGAAGGIATQPLNRVLDDFGLAGGISTKIDTSTASPRPEVEFQIARDISIQIAWVLGVTPGTNPDTTLVTFDWRFLQRWSLETTVGDSGTSILDVVWKYHY
jgi:translocation and assembly module TamB